MRRAWQQAMLQLYGNAGTAPSFDDIMNTGRPLTEAFAATLTDAMKRGVAGLETRVDPRFIERLTNDIWVFSGCKSYNELKEMTALLKDSSGALKPFYQFAQDVSKIDDRYNRQWLNAEYNHAVGSSRMAAKWQQYENAEFNLQYRTAQDEKVRENHAALNGITLPPSDEFWNEYYPPNGWNCRCNVVQVNKENYTESNSSEAQQAGERATTYIDKDGRNRSAMFRFNPGKEGALFPEQHPYYNSAPRRKIEGWMKETNVIQQEVRLADEVKSLPEARKRFTQLFTEKLGVIPGSVSFSDKMTLEKINLYLNHINKLLSEYKPSMVYKSDKPFKLIFKGGAAYNGRVKVDSLGFLLEIDFGRRGSYSRLNKDKIKIFQFSRIDEVNANLSSVYHEFAHVISMDFYTHASHLDARIQPFWNEIGRIKKSYHKEINSLISDPATRAEFDKIYLGDYASTNMNEFMAEAFTEYKLRSNPSKYAVEVGELIDKTFKR